MKILFFDVETTGFKSKDFVPHILQLAFLVYNDVTMTIETEFDSFINIDSGLEISPFITTLTGITRECCNGGISMDSALRHFYNAYKRSDIIVAHNIAFDREMILIEVARNCAKIAEKSGYCKMNSLFSNQGNSKKKIICTMHGGKRLCDIWITHNNSRFLKCPKLSELYNTLFGSVPEGCHNALMDTKICMRCYLKMHDMEEPDVVRKFFEPADVIKHVDTYNFNAQIMSKDMRGVGYVDTGYDVDYNNRYTTFVAASLVKEKSMCTDIAPVALRRSHRIQLLREKMAV